MIDCYTGITDNGYKPRMMLEVTPEDKGRAAALPARRGHVPRL